MKRNRLLVYGLVWLCSSSCWKETTKEIAPAITSMRVQPAKCDYCVDYQTWNNEVDTYGTYLDSVTAHLDSGALRNLLRLIESQNFHTASALYSISLPAISEIINRYAATRNTLVAMLRKIPATDKEPINYKAFANCVRSCQLPGENEFADPYGPCQDQLNKCNSDAADRLWDGLIENCAGGMLALGTISPPGGLIYGIGCWGYYEWRYFRDRRRCSAAYAQCIWG
jgi:hypothetical protein